MEDQVQAFDEVLDLMHNRGIERTEAVLIATLMRKPARAAAFKQWLAANPKATDEEVSKQATQIARIVEPTRHGTSQK